MTTDKELLATYLTPGPKSAEAFHTLAERYTPLIYSTARRQAPAHLAEDITQAVFLLLAQKAKTLRNPELLPAWLLKITRYCAANARRADQRRRHHEQKAAAMSPTIAPTDPDPDSLAPHLDTALLSLVPADRTALLLRFYNDNSFPEIATALNLTEDAAKKRVTRALEKLRKLFAKKHLTLAAPILATLLAKNALATPPTLAATCATAALTPTAASPAAALIAKSTAKLIAWSTAKLTTASTIAVLLLATTTATILHLQKASVAASPSPPPAASGGTGDARPSTVPFVQESPRIPTDPSPLITVRDITTNQPLAGAHIELSPGYRGGPSTFADTAPDGTARVPLPPTFIDGYDVIVRKDGYVPAQQGGYRNFPNDQLAAAFSFQLEKATTIGGRVLDQNKNPLPNALVQVIIVKQYKNLPQFIPWFLPITTNAQGEWSLNAAPADPDRIEVGAIHPACASFGSISINELPIPALRNRTATITLHRAPTVHAIVRDPDNKPIQAFVGLSDQRIAINTDPEFPTSPDGQFDFVPSFEDLNFPGPAYLTIHAPGCASQIVQFKPNDPQPLVISLAPANPLNVRIVDPDGHPIPNAVLAPDYYQSPEGRNSRGTDKFFISDSSGQISWPEAFNEHLFVNLSARGYLTQNDTPIDPGQPNEITMLPHFVVHATVIDDTTHQPAANFRVAEGTFDSVNHKDLHYTDYPEWPETHIHTTGPGTFDFTDTEQHDRFVLRIFDGGYEPKNSQTLLTDGHDQSITIRVHKGTPLTGTLLDTDGNPLPKTYVYLHTTWLDVYDADLPTKPTVIPGYDDSARFSLTDAAGHFSFNPQKNEFTIIVSTNVGYALTKSKTFEQSHTVQLLPWARIEGTLLTNGQPTPDAPISINLSAPDLQTDIGPYCHFNTKTDAAGHFSFPKAFAGPYYIDKKQIKAVPGETTTIIINR